MPDMPPEMIEAAKNLARQHAAKEPEITEIWLFPDNEMIRLVEVSENEMPSGEDNSASPYYFGPNQDLVYHTGFALILPEEVKKVNPPEGWCEWDKAQKIWPEGDA